MEKAESEKEPHVLVFPFPGQSHVTPALMLAELLALSGGLHVTFLNTDHMHRRLSPALLAHLDRLPRFRFRTIHDGLPPDDPRRFLDFLTIERSIRTHSKQAFKNLLQLLPLMPEAKEEDESNQGWPPVSCVLADGIMTMALDVAEEVGIPVILLRTSSPCGFWAYHHIPDLITLGQIPFPEDVNLDEMARGVPGMERLLRLRDLPSFCRKAKSSTDTGLRFLATATTNTSRARGLIFNTFEALDGLVLSHIRSLYPNTYAVGPLHTHLRSYRSRMMIPSSVGGQGAAANSVGAWQADRACMAWLDAQPRQSVVYVSFGSAVVVTREELLELWHGLVGSGQRFLWVMRPDMVKGGEGVAVAEELEKGTRERGCVVAWAPQEEVLAHPSVGCFLSHSGWSSTLESVAAGVPLICWPLFADQHVNSRFASEVWGVGTDMKDTCERGVVERMVREAMTTTTTVEGERLRRSAGELAKLARDSVEEGGASWANLHGLVQLIRSMTTSN